ncbi:hypothetical protein [Streptomyces albogriseolus]|uniref:hypothetical protein n=1 Tax=Streptomyces albogriseolus TaxID=1887 RepID=UPI003CED6866
MRNGSPHRRAALRGVGRAGGGPPSQEPRRTGDVAGKAAVVGTWIAGIGLIFTAITTYQANELTDEQSKQTEAQNEEYEKSLAQRVQIWEERDKEQRIYAVLANRSQSPLRAVVVMFGGGGRSRNVVFSSMAPCTRVSFKADKAVEGNPAAVVRIESVMFLDDKGFLWLREPYAGVKPVSEVTAKRRMKSIHDIREFFREDFPRGVGPPKSSFEPEELEDC